MLQHASRHHDPGRVQVGRAPEVAVDADDGCLRRHVLLELRHLLARSEDRAAAEHRRELVEPVLVAGPRGCDHEQGHVAVRRELHDLLVRDARHELGALRVGGGGEQAEQDGDGEQAESHSRAGTLPE